MIPRYSAVFVNRLPDWTNATARVRNSFGYLRGMSRAFHSRPNSTPKVETTPAAGQIPHLTVQQTQLNRELCLRVREVGTNIIGKKL